MSHPVLYACAIGCLFLFCQHQAALGGPTLVKNGQSRHRIVLPAAPIASEKYAAEELQRYIQKMTGAKLPILQEPTGSAGLDILLGRSAGLERMKLNVDWQELGTDGFLLRTVGNAVIVAGGRPRGTLNGVYTLLEEKLGVRWFTPELEIVPRVERLQLPDLNEIKLPALENREVFWTEMMRDGDFAARHRLNGNHLKLTEKHGGRFAVYYPFVHSFDLLVPPSLFTNHPDYFPLIKGKRVGGYVQRCLSNPEVLRMTIERVREWIRTHPEATIISVSQNDTFNYCQCESCKTLDDAEGSPAASLLKFVNAVAENIERDYPNVRIDTLAYQYTRKPPKSIRPRRNVIIRLCSIECCFAHSLEDCPSEANRRFRDDIIAWQPVAPLLYVWDYTPNFAHYQQPFPNFDVLQPNVRFFIKHNVRGLFEQGNYSPGGFGELGPLRAYVLAKLLWNPESNVQGHVDEFCAAYYGNAAPKIQEFLRLMHAQVRGKDVHAHIFDSPKARYLNDEFLQQADRVLAEAEARAADDTTRFHVQLARLPVWYVQIANQKVTGETREKLLQQFLLVARKAGISHISESQALDAWAAKNQKPGT